MKAIKRQAAHLKMTKTVRASFQPEPSNKTDKKSSTRSQHGRTDARAPRERNARKREKSKAGNQKSEAKPRRAWRVEHHKPGGFSH